MSLRQRGYDELTEASEVSLKDIEPANQKKVMTIQSVTKCMASQIFSGIIGDIAVFKVSAPMVRFSLDILKKLTALKIRWLETDSAHGTFSVGL